ncbi:hypothetical protein AB6A40_005578 [Gnathostoma spinigerum]|uniref:EH domain-containing protein n=1 Tax=Gnathostoma spinigerum TaxID=75299 RepID=A0ABD6EFU0_9BILA
MPPIAEISFPHHQIYENLYKELNPRNKETVAANEAALFLKRSNLSVSLLGQIWEIADHSKNGFLTKEGAFIAFKLVAACQQNLPIHESSLTLPLAAPVFDSRSATPSIPNISGLSVSSSWGISASDQSKYEAIFDSLNPVDGKVPGDKVRPVLLNSGLPSVSLAKIWELSDIDKVGRLLPL